MVAPTPGPWEIHEHRHIDGEFWCTIGANGRGPITDIVGEEGNKSRHYMPVAGMTCLITPVEVQRANARLIAAAPDLLACAEDFLRLLTYTVDDAAEAAGFAGDIEDRTRAAIRRARGEAAP